jgi:hypothetical protein
MTLIEQLVRRIARRTTKDGAVVLITNGEPVLLAAFADLGWSDPYPDPLLLPPKPIPALHGVRMATVTAPEKAVLPRPKGSIGGL